MDLVVHKPEIAHFHAATLRIKAETGVADKSLQQLRPIPSNVVEPVELVTVYVCGKDRKVNVTSKIARRSLAPEIALFRKTVGMAGVCDAENRIARLSVNADHLEIGISAGCGRTKIDLVGLANQVETLVQGYDLNIKVAVMGCAVNGPGEAREADIGIAGGQGEGLLIKRGKIVRKMKEEYLLAALKEELDNWQG